MIKKGTDEVRLMDALQELDSCTASQSIFTHGQDVCIKAKMHHGMLKDWCIVQGEGGKPSKPIAYAKGIGYTNFLHALKENVNEAVFDENLVVLCYSYAEMSRTAENKLKTHWILLNPAVPFEIVNGRPEFPMLQLDLTDSEYKIAMESRMALYDEYKEDLYPIREIAFSSIGKLLDSAASFKNIPEIPLGPALLLSERIAMDMKELKLIYRGGDGRFKPLIGVAGSRFAEDSEYGFFRTALKSTTDMFGYYNVASWEINDQVSMANVYISTNDGSSKALREPERYNAFAMYQNFPVFLKMQTSDIPGTSASITAYAQIGDGKVAIQKNSAYHWDSFVKKGGSASLFYRTEKCKKKQITFSLKDDIDAFEKSILELKDKEITLTKKISKKVQEIITLIGKKNYKVKKTGIDAIMDSKEKWNAYSLLEGIINATYVTLPTKQAGELAVLYGELVELI